MAVEILKITTVGTPLYDSETGPDTGYGDVAEYLMVVPDGFDGFDVEDTRSVVIMARVDTIGM